MYVIIMFWSLLFWIAALFSPRLEVYAPFCYAAYATGYLLDVLIVRVYIARHRLYGDPDMTPLWCLFITLFASLAVIFLASDCSYNPDLGCQADWFWTPNKYSSGYYLDAWRKQRWG